MVCYAVLVLRRFFGVSWNPCYLNVLFHPLHGWTRFVDRSSDESISSPSAFVGMYYGFFILAPLWIIVVIMPFVFCSFLRGRLFLRVTYTDFEIRRTLGFPKRCESCSSEHSDGWQPSFIDRLLLKQTNGLTKYLQNAEVCLLWPVLNKNGRSADTGGRNLVR